MNNKGETEPNKNNPPKTAKPSTKSNKSKSGGALLGFFVFLTFILAISGIGAGYYFWQQLQQELATAQDERNKLKQSLSALDENPRIKQYRQALDSKLDKASSSIKSVNKNLVDLETRQKRIESTIQDTYEIVNRSQTGWMLKEVEHVLRMSQYRLLLDRDFQGALLGLSAADKRLGEIDNVRLIPIRESIARQKKILKQYPHPDYVGIQLTLDNTIAQLTAGLLKIARVSVREESKPEQTEPHVTSNSKMDAEEVLQIIVQFIQDTIDRAVTALNRSVKVTHSEQKIALFIEEQEKKRSYDFLRQKLLGAKYAVSTRDNLSFQQQLNAALAWLENNDDIGNKDLLIKEINSLAENDLLPKLPDISEPSILLNKYLADVKE